MMNLKRDIPAQRVGDLISKADDLITKMDHKLHYSQLTARDQCRNPQQGPKQNYVPDY